MSEKPLKNYVVSNLFRLGSSKWAWTDRAQEGDIYEQYHRMYRISLASFKHFLAGDWEPILWTGEVEHSCKIAEANWPLQYDLWHKEPCNILYHGPDTLMIKPTEIFDKFSGFELFNYTDPKALRIENPYGWDIPHYLNDDLRYMPHSMDPKLWETGAEWAKNWNTENNDLGWNYGQVLHNIMYWNQNRTLEETLRPKMFWQAFMLPGNIEHITYLNHWNNCDIVNAHVLHCAGSRGAKAKADMMYNIARDLGIPLDGV
jgi:hypothetical protein